MRSANKIHITCFVLCSFSRSKGKQGPAGQRCVHEAHEAHEAHVAHLAHLAHPVHQAHSAMSMLDCPNDFRIENGSFSAFKKNGLPTDHRTNRRTRPHIEMRGRI